MKSYMSSPAGLEPKYPFWVSFAQEADKGIGFEP